MYKGRILYFNFLFWNVLIWNFFLRFFFHSFNFINFYWVFVAFTSSILNLPIFPPHLPSLCPYNLPHKIKQTLKKTSKQKNKTESEKKKEKLSLWKLWCKQVSHTQFTLQTFHLDLQVHSATRHSSDLKLVLFVIPSVMGLSLGLAQTSGSYPMPWRSWSLGCTGWSPSPALKQLIDEVNMGLDRP